MCWRRRRITLVYCLAIPAPISGAYHHWVGKMRFQSVAIAPDATDLSRLSKPSHKLVGSIHRMRSGDLKALDDSHHLFWKCCHTFPCAFDPMTCEDERERSIDIILLQPASYCAPIIVWPDFTVHNHLGFTDFRSDIPQAVDCVDLVITF
jgi:hypothetical protein